MPIPDVTISGASPVQVRAMISSTDLGAAIAGGQYGDSLWSKGNIETFSRSQAGGDITQVDGVLWVTFFGAPVTATVTSLGVSSGATAGTGRTLARLGLFTVDATTNALTLVARTANSAALGNATFQSASAGLNTTGGYPASYTLTAGTRYALGFLQVGGTLCSVRVASQVCADIPPIMSCKIASQTDILASYTSTAVNTGVHFERAYMFGLA